MSRLDNRASSMILYLHQEKPPAELPGIGSGANAPSGGPDALGAAPRNGAPAPGSEKGSSSALDGGPGRGKKEEQSDDSHETARHEPVRVGQTPERGRVGAHRASGWPVVVHPAARRPAVDHEAGIPRSELRYTGASHAGLLRFRVPVAGPSVSIKEKEEPS